MFGIKRKFKKKKKKKEAMEIFEEREFKWKKKQGPKAWGKNMFNGVSKNKQATVAGVEYLEIGKV